MAQPPSKQWDVGHSDAVELACQKAHQRCGIAKPVTPHSLRHYPEFQTIPSNPLPSFVSKEFG
jgi:hypothetical protein